MSVFEDQQPTRRPTIKRSKATEIAMKLGAKNEAQASLLWIIICAILIGGTWYTYKKNLSSNPDTEMQATPIEELSPEDRAFLEGAGII